MYRIEFEQFRIAARSRDKADIQPLSLNIR